MLNVSLFQQIEPDDDFIRNVEQIINLYHSGIKVKCETK